MARVIYIHGGERLVPESDLLAVEARAAAEEEREKAALRERDEARAIARGRLNALLNYGRHPSDCAQPARGLRCSCGLDGWLKEGPAEKR